MITDSEIQQEGLRALVDQLGEVGAERFITLLLREPFDYTEWRKNLWVDVPVRELSKQAMRHVHSAENEWTKRSAAQPVFSELRESSENIYSTEEDDPQE
jgi:hypothetical protein